MPYIIMNFFYSIDNTQMVVKSLHEHIEMYVLSFILRCYMLETGKRIKLRMNFVPALANKSVNN